MAGDIVVSGKRRDSKSGKLFYLVENPSRNTSKEWVSMKDLASDPDVVDAIEYYEHDFFRKSGSLAPETFSPSSASTISDTESNDLVTGNSTLSQVSSINTDSEDSGLDNSTTDDDEESDEIEEFDELDLDDDDSETSSRANHSAKRIKTKNISEKQIMEISLPLPKLKPMPKSTAKKVVPTPKIPYHHRNCERCGKGKMVGRRSKYEGDYGELQYCSTCTATVHENCVPRTKKSKDAFKCSDCTKLDPVCWFCKLNDVDDKINPPFFRCERCNLVAHWGCLTKEFSKQSGVERDEIGDGGRGSSKWFADQSQCIDCLRWHFSIDLIITYNESPEGRQYYVKFTDFSYRSCKWVSGRWVEGMKAEKMKVRNFWKTVEAESKLEPKKWPLAPEKSFNPEFAQVDRILKVEKTKNVASLFPLDERKRNNSDSMDNTRVFVKWKSLPYDQCTWEDWPYPEDEDYSSFVDALTRLDEASSIPENHNRYLKSLEGNKQRPKFKEFKEQPACVVNGQLKDYQLEGLNWLLYKWTKYTSCVLADEMGLGKTVQLVSFINCLYHHYNQPMPFLVIAPTSTLGHWYNEFHKWAPKLNVVQYAGSATSRQTIRENELFRTAKRKGGILKCHVLLSSYESIMVDVNFFADVQFEAVVADEGHRLKNDSSKTFLILAQKIHARHRILMTGTPLQNNLRELFNLMSYLDPERFSDQAAWEARYAQMTEENVIKLHEELKPYFLRRTKSVALKDMPLKTEFLVPVSLTPLQKQIYKAFLAKNFTALRQNLSKTDNNIRMGNFQNILMQLRKICNHPYLIPHIENRTLSPAAAHEQLVASSGKLQLLEIMLRQLKDRGHRVLLFSQFKIALAIVEDFLLAEGYLYCELDGDTPAAERQKMIDRFNADDSPYFIFLLTTRAGGLGINLVSADTVIIFDADWNPHQDIQAMARAHRIGQKKDVAVYKLFTKNCVEERIIEIGKNKMVLDHLVVESMEAGSSLSKDEVASIIRFGATALFDENNPDDASLKEIKYDEDSVAKLLDERGLATESTEAQHNAHAKFGNFSFAKVWQTDEIEVEVSEEQPAVIEPSVSLISNPPEIINQSVSNDNEDENNQAFWDRLAQKVGKIADVPINSMIIESDDSGSRRLRQRATVNYLEQTKTIQKRLKKGEGDENDSEYDPSGDEDELRSNIDDDLEDTFPEPPPLEKKAEHFKKLPKSHKLFNAPSKQSNTNKELSSYFSTQIDPMDPNTARCWICLKFPVHSIMECSARGDGLFLLQRLQELLSFSVSGGGQAEETWRYKIAVIHRLLRFIGVNLPWRREIDLAAMKGKTAVEGGSTKTLPKKNNETVVIANNNDRSTHSSKLKVPNGANDLAKKTGTNSKLSSVDSNLSFEVQLKPLNTVVKGPVASSVKWVPQMSSNAIPNDGSQSNSSSSNVVTKIARLSSIPATSASSSTVKSNQPSNNSPAASALPPRQQSFGFPQGAFDVDTSPAQAQKAATSTSTTTASSSVPSKRVLLSESIVSSSSIANFPNLESLTKKRKVDGETNVTTLPEQQPDSFESGCIICEGDHLWNHCQLVKQRGAFSRAKVAERLKENKITKSKAEEILLLINLFEKNQVKPAKVVVTASVTPPSGSDSLAKVVVSSSATPASVLNSLAKEVGGNSAVASMSLNHNAMLTNGTISNKPINPVIQLSTKPTNSPVTSNINQAPQMLTNMTRSINLPHIMNNSRNHLQQVSTNVTNTNNSAVISNIPAHQATQYSSRMENDINSPVISSVPMNHPWPQTNQMQFQNALPVMQPNVATYFQAPAPTFVQPGYYVQDKVQQFWAVNPTDFASMQFGSGPIQPLMYQQQLYAAPIMQQQQQQPVQSYLSQPSVMYELSQMPMNRETTLTQLNVAPTANTKEVIDLTLDSSSGEEDSKVQEPIYQLVKHDGKLFNAEAMKRADKDDIDWMFGGGSSKI